MSAPESAGITGNAAMKVDMMIGVADLDQSSLARVRNRDPDSLRATVDQHSRRLYRAARGMGFSVDEAEDLTQEVFVTFVASLERFERRAQVGTWLFGILHHKVQERRRTQAREELNDPIDTVFESQFDARGAWIRPPVAPDERVSAREAGEAIRDCLDSLPARQREVFQLRQVEEFSGAEVSKILAQTVTHIGVLFHRARARLRDCLERKGWSGSA